MSGSYHKNGSIPCLGLLKIDGSGGEQNGELRPRSRINDTDSEYVKMAKIGGHASRFYIIFYFNPFSRSLLIALFFVAVIAKNILQLDFT